MTDPTLPAQLAKFVGTLGMVEVVVRVSAPADNWLLDLVTPKERDQIRRRFFEEELAKPEKRLARETGLRIKQYPDRGEATVAGQPDAVYDLVRPGGVLAQHAQFEVLGRFRIVNRPMPPSSDTSSSASDSAIGHAGPRRIDSPRLPASV